MPKTMLDEYYLRLFVPANLASDRVRAVRRVIDSKQFRTRLTKAIQQYCRHFPSLKPVTIKLLA